MRTLVLVLVVVSVMVSGCFQLAEVAPLEDAGADAVLPEPMPCVDEIGRLRGSEWVCGIEQNSRWECYVEKTYRPDLDTLEACAAGGGCPIPRDALQLCDGEHPECTGDVTSGTFIVLGVCEPGPRTACVGLER